MKKLIAITVLAPTRKVMYVGKEKFVEDKKDAVVYDDEIAGYAAMSKILNTPETYCSGFYLLDT